MLVNDRSKITVLTSCASGTKTGINCESKIVNIISLCAELEDIFPDSNSKLTVAIQLRSTFEFEEV